MVVVEFEGGNINCEIVNKPNGGILYSTLHCKISQFEIEKFENPLIVVVKIETADQSCIYVLKILLDGEQLAV